MPEFFHLMIVNLDDNEDEGLQLRSCVFPDKKALVVHVEPQTWKETKSVDDDLLPQQLR